MFTFILVYVVIFLVVGVKHIIQVTFGLQRCYLTPKVSPSLQLGINFTVEATFLLPAEIFVLPPINRSTRPILLWWLSEN